MESHTVPPERILGLYLPLGLQSISVILLGLVVSTQSLYLASY
jgi:hypothetical protein